MRRRGYRLADCSNVFGGGSTYAWGTDQDDDNDDDRNNRDLWQFIAKIVRLRLGEIFHSLLGSHRPA